ncbi:MAG: hypothetical protein A3B31_01250 [Candidatus Komeilibacteria bacterium RIFCSPLOWO2_01_FULL_53_11]|uniref:Uncharacterized protein n=1 Tax=Candidatus Komeilibacteria bacterium RIFCSPLOWO2_01_FULL_53_11 TaxID=1798552 RepID=A0A1G2BQR6_9BACT|nr:MAG: hypothetical protein A3B31_01250 [Candidatus Komeilibacteria bacterium RIFCSPLOWO2_01_FULL_53_11]
MNLINWFLTYFNLVLALASIVMLIGIVWHVEQVFDASYKFFLVAAVILAIKFFIDILHIARIVPFHDAVGHAFDTLVIIFFTFGVLEMRQLIEKLGREKPDAVQQKRRMKSAQGSSAVSSERTRERPS